MRENVTGIRGEFRELTSKEIGDFVRSMRKLRETKRLVLADQAGISEKSLERLESGIRVSDEVYRKVALAVGQKEDAFLGPRYIATPEEALKKAIESLEKLESDHKKWKAENLLIDASPFTNEHDIRQILDCWGAMLVNYSEIEGEAVDMAAAFKQNLTDWCDIADEIGETGRLDACRSLLGEIREIERCGYVARFGTYKANFSIRSERTTVMPVGVVIFFARSDWKNLSYKKMAVRRQIDEVDV
jgi:transcriptional regulator with XRE-family HTH domain